MVLIFTLEFLLRYVRVFAASVLCRLSVTFVCPTQGVETFSKISSPFCTLAILWPPCKILRRSSQRNPSVGGVKRKRGIKQSDVTFGYLLSPDESLAVLLTSTWVPSPSPSTQPSKPSTSPGTQTASPSPIPSTWPSNPSTSPSTRFLCLSTVQVQVQALTSLASCYFLS